MNFSISKLVVFTIVLSAILIKVTDKNFGKNGNYGAVDWDNFGYYLYLPATFIYDDLKLQNDNLVIELQKKYDLSSSYYQAHSIHNGNRIIQYTSGIAIIYSPAFFTAHAWASLSSKYPADGFSFPYQLCVLIEAFLILFLGLLYLRKFSLLFFNEKTTALILLILGFGTNFLQIASINISSPHIVLFTAYCIALYYTYKWHERPTVKSIFIVALITALMTLSRPNELLFAIIPVFWIGGVFTNIRDKVFFLIKNPIQPIAAAIPFVIFGIIQPLYWKYTSGEWIFDTYINEDFKLLSPYLSEFLFSFKKGWLLYTPIMVFALVGFVPFFKRNQQLSIPFIAFTILNIWILSSWDCWWYAGSFSQRSIVQSYPIFILPLGFLLQSVQSKKQLSYIVSPIIVLLVLFNLFQTYQFNQGILDSSRMTKEYYFATFLDTKSNQEKKKLLEPLRDINYIPEHENLRRIIIHKESFSTIDNTFDSLNEDSFIKEGSLFLTKEKPTYYSFVAPFSEIYDTTYAYFFARIRYRSDFPANENPFGIVAKVKDSKSGKVYKQAYRGVEHISWFEQGSWSSMDLLFIPPFLRNENDSLLISLQLLGSDSVEIDQFYVEMLTPSSDSKLNSKQYLNDYHTIVEGEWSNAIQLAKEKNYEQIDSVSPYSSTLKVKNEELSGRKVVFEIIGSANNEESNETYAVISIADSDGESSFYESIRVDPEIMWHKQQFSFKLPKKVDSTDVVKMYLWNKSKIPYYIRLMNVKVNQ